MEAGLEMARPKRYGDQQLRTYKMYKRNLGVSAITEYIELDFDRPVSKRTVERWVNGFQAARTENNDLDQPVDWSRLDELQLPQGATAFLLSLWAYSINHSLDGELSRTSDGSVCPTIRQVRWWWKTHQASPTAPLITIFLMGNELADREVLRELDLGPPEDHDIWAFLALGQGGDASLYQRAVENGRIKHWTVLGRRDAGVVQQIKEASE
tara:strand:+ start:532 stop:1164 length:633 start_codon:yes stop_codon:yes gene_type:complete